MAGLSLSNAGGSDAGSSTYGKSLSPRVRRRATDAECASVFSGRLLIEELISGMPSSDDVVDVIDELFYKFDTIDQIISASPQKLEKIKGITPQITNLLKTVKYISLKIANERIIGKPALHNWNEIEIFCKNNLSSLRVQKISSIHLYPNDEIIKCEDHQSGSISRVSIIYRELIRRVLELDSAKVIIVHYMPNARISFTPEEIEYINNMQYKMNLIEVELTDYIKISKSGITRFYNYT